MDHDTNTCTLRQWPASARGVIQVRPGTIIGGGGGGGGGGGSCCPLQTQYEKWGPVTGKLVRGNFGPGPKLSLKILVRPDQTYQK